MTDHLDALSNTELNEVFALRVAKWKPTAQDHEFVRTWDDLVGGGYVTIELCRPRYTDDVDLVLPWLKAQPGASTIYVGPDYWVQLFSEPSYSSRPPALVTEAVAPTLARAVMLTLIRAARNEPAPKQSGWKS